MSGTTPTETPDQDATAALERIDTVQRAMHERRQDTNSAGGWAVLAIGIIVAAALLSTRDGLSGFVQVLIPVLGLGLGVGILVWVSQRNERTFGIDIGTDRKGRAGSPAWWGEFFAPLLGIAWLLHLTGAPAWSWIVLAAVAIVGGPVFWRNRRALSHPTTSEHTGGDASWSTDRVALDLAAALASVDRGSLAALAAVTGRTEPDLEAAGRALVDDGAAEQIDDAGRPAFKLTRDGRRRFAAYVAQLEASASAFSRAAP